MLYLRFFKNILVNMQSLLYFTNCGRQAVIKFKFVAVVAVRYIILRDIPYINLNVFF